VAFSAAVPISAQVQEVKSSGTTCAEQLALAELLLHLLLVHHLVLVMIVFFGC
jgi:hypothetical protein